MDFAARPSPPQEAEAEIEEVLKEAQTEGGMPNLQDMSTEELEALLMDLFLQIPREKRIPLPAPAYEVIFHDIERQLLRARRLAARQRPIESLPLFRWRRDRVRAVVRKERRRQRLAGKVSVVEASAAPEGVEMPVSGCAGAEAQRAMVGAGA